MIYVSLESTENKLSFGILDSIYNSILRLQSVTINTVTTQAISKF